MLHTVCKVLMLVWCPLCPADGHRQLVQLVPEERERAGHALAHPAQLLRGASTPLHSGTFLRAPQALGSLLPGSG